MNWNISVNGTARQVPAALTVADLLDSLGLNRDGVAVAVDRQVVPRSEHGRRQLHDGASVEVIRAVGGG